MVKFILKLFLIGHPKSGSVRRMRDMKPCMITDWPHPDQRLQHAIDQSRLVLSGIHVVSFPRYILCHKDIAELTSRYATIEKKIFAGGILDENEIANRIQFSQDHQGIRLDTDTHPHNSAKSFSARHSAADIIGAECDLLIRREIHATLPIMTGINHSHACLPPEIRSKLAAGDLSATLIHTRTEESAVLAQAACAEMGKELFARYFLNEDGYASLRGTPDFTKRIGYLLGYTLPPKENLLT